MHFIKFSYSVPVKSWCSFDQSHKINETRRECESSPNKRKRTVTCLVQCLSKCRPFVVLHTSERYSRTISRIQLKPSGVTDWIKSVILCYKWRPHWTTLNRHGTWRFFLLFNENFTFPPCFVDFLWSIRSSPWLYGYTVYCYAEPESMMCRK